MALGDTVCIPEVFILSPIYLNIRVREDIKF